MLKYKTRPRNAGFVSQYQVLRFLACSVRSRTLRVMKRDGFTVLPDYIIREFGQVSEDLSLTYGSLNLYKQLFIHSQSRFDLLISSAGAFFEFLFHILRDDVLIRICRLSDRAGMGRGNENLTLPWLMKKLTGECEDTALLAKLRDQLAAFLDDCASIRSHRDKRIAHRDLKVSLEQAKEPLPGISLQDIQNALRHASEFLNEIDGYFCDTETLYKEFSMAGDADDLVSRLVEAMRYDQLRHERRIPLGDLDKGEWLDALGVTECD